MVLETRKFKSVMLAYKVALLKGLESNCPVGTQDLEFSSQEGHNANLEALLSASF